jgi:hypothetical protein
MAPGPERDACALLERLVDALGQHDDRARDVARLLHDGVVLHRLDGTRVEGRVAVADAIVNHGVETRFRAIGRTDVGGVHVAMAIEGLPGELRFVLTGTVDETVLLEIRMG